MAIMPGYLSARLGCPGHEANGAYVVSQYNHIWNLLQGITSDGGTLYYNIGNNSGAGKGIRYSITWCMMLRIHRLSMQASTVRHTAATAFIPITNPPTCDVENNVVYRISWYGIQHSDGIAPGESPILTTTTSSPMPGRPCSRCLQPGVSPDARIASLRDNITNNIFVFDRDVSQGFHVTEGCAYSCGLEYDKFLNFQGNLYWRTDGKFSTYDKAFSVLAAPPPNAKMCGPTISDKPLTFLTFAQWQAGNMHEDTQGTASVNPGFGNTGKPTDFLLTKAPIAGFDYTKTNDTIRHAGRDHP